MNRFILRLLLCFISVSYALSARAQQKVTGRILDEHRGAMDGAVVLLITVPQGVLVESTLTDDTGAFSLLPREGGLPSMYPFARI